MLELFDRLESNARSYVRVYPTVFDTALNARQTDVEGREYIDFFAGAGVLNYGHNHPRLRQAMVDYLLSNGVVHSLDMASRAKAHFMQRFEDVVLKPRHLDYKLQFTGPTGSNVVEAALKLARKVTGRTTVVAFTNAFHGMTLGSLACTGNQHFRNAAGVALNDVLRVPFEGYPGAGADTLAPLRAALADTSSGIAPPAAFIVETLQAEGGVHPASAEWLQAVQTLAQEHGSLFIVDDIQVGCGRTGSFFSFETLGIEPDLVCLAKGIGGYGTPMGLLLIKPEYDQWAPGEHTGTFRGQNLSFVAGAEALAFFEDEAFLPAVIKKGEVMRARCAALAESAGVQVRGRGMILGLDMGSGARSSAVVQAAFQAGLIVAACGTGGRVVKLIPPLTIEDDTLDAGLALLETAVERSP